MLKYTFAVILLREEINYTKHICEEKIFLAHNGLHLLLEKQAGFSLFGFLFLHFLAHQNVNSISFFTP